MCDCLKNLENRLEEKFKEEHPEATVKESFFTNSAFIQRGLKDGKVSMPLELTANHMIKYIVTSKKGKELKRKEEISICFAYCPFCGEKLEGGNKK